MSPAFAYHGNKLRFAKLMEKKETIFEPQSEDQDQFALEMDHFSECILQNKTPYTPGEEGLQVHKIMEAIYEAAASGTNVRIAVPSTPTRGRALKPY